MLYNFHDRNYDIQTTGTQEKIPLKPRRIPNLEGIVEKNQDRKGALQLQAEPASLTALTEIRDRDYQFLWRRNRDVIVMEQDHCQFFQ